MAVRVIWADPGPEAEAALRHYWALSYEIAGDILRRQALEEMAAGTRSSEPKRKSREPG